MDTERAEALERLRSKLVSEGEAELDSPPGPIAYTANSEANALLRNLADYPHAFLTSCLMDRQSKASAAALIPFSIQGRLGTFAIDRLAQLSESDCVELFTQPSPLHRFPTKMAHIFHAGIQRVVQEYAGDAGQIWADKPSSARVVRRFLAFEGVGPKIATMAANLLVRDFHVHLSDYYSIDISADVHVVRVMRRLGFVKANGDDALVDTVFAAREMNPTFPGIFDMALWRLGQTICRPQKPLCEQCPLKSDCEYFAMTSNSATD